MAEQLQWNIGSKKVLQTGVSKGVLYPRVGSTYPLGVAIEGLTNVTETPGGDEPTELYANNTKYTTLLSAPTFGGTIESFVMPEEFMVCDGADDADANGVYVSMQPRQSFGLSYRVEVYSDEGGNVSIRYLIHLVYACLTKPSEMAHATIGESPEAGSLSYEFTTTPVNVTGKNPTAHLVIDSTKTDPALLAWLETQLYGVDAPATPANLPLPDEILSWTA